MKNVQNAKSLNFFPNQATETVRLEEALLDFPGCAVVTSHDRWFLDRIATHILAFEGDSGTVWFEGNYEDYHNYMINIAGEDTKNPKYRHKKLA